MDDNHTVRLLLSIISLGVIVYVLVMTPSLQWMQQYWKILGYFLITVTGMASFLVILWLVWHSPKPHGRLSKKLEKEIKEHHKTRKR